MTRAVIAAILGAALALAGAGFDSPSLLVPGIALAGLAAVSAAWIGLATYGVSLERASGPARIVEGESYPLRITARGGRVPPPGGELQDALLDRPIGIGPRWTGTLALDLPLAGRGQWIIGPARLIAHDPLRLCTRVLTSEPAGELLVLPRIEPVLAAGHGAGGRALLEGVDIGATGRIDARAIDLEVDGLRAYREGSPASRIHWPAVARTGELIERRMVDGGDSAPVVALDARNPADEAALDAAVRAAASLCFALASGRGCGVLLPGDRRATEIEPDLRAWPAVHARLALVAAGDPAPVPANLAGTLFWVTAAATPRPPRRGGTRSGALYVVSPRGPHHGGSAVFTVAGCVGLLVSGATRRRVGTIGRSAA